MREPALRYATRAARALALAALLAGGLAALADQPAIALAGLARVIDGDTLDIGGTRVRLEGIDAPEADQRCATADRGSWACGRAATRHLEDQIRGAEVRCENHGHDSYGRMLGVCYVGELELNADMVREGFAWAFVKYSVRYVDAEREARTLKAGIWQGEAEPAWDFRAHRWASAQQTAPEGCAIKGNLTRQGRVYHTPWSPWYDKTRIDLARGERWFCSESEALAAGWRPAGR
jgi:endonuclease YncB( thermonuclease family)